MDDQLIFPTRYKGAEAAWIDPQWEVDGECAGAVARQLGWRRPTETLRILIANLLRGVSPGWQCTGEAINMTYLVVAEKSGVSDHHWRRSVLALHANGMMEREPGAPGRASAMRPTARLVDTVRGTGVHFLWRPRQTHVVIRGPNEERRIVTRGDADVDPTLAQILDELDVVNQHLRKFELTITRRVDDGGVESSSVESSSVESSSVESSSVEGRGAGGRLSSLSSSGGLSSVSAHSTVRVHVAYKRTFHETLDRHGRFYAYFQNFSKGERRTLRIDGEPTVELDISSCHPRLLLHATGHEAPIDAYMFPGSRAELRPVYKRAVLILLNAKSRPSAVAAFTHWLAEEKEAGRVQKRLSAKRIFEQVERSYPEGARQHFYGDTAGWMMNLDSRICAGVLRRSVEAGICILTVHDAYICAQRHEAAMYHMVQASYAEVLGPGRRAVLKRTGLEGVEQVVGDANYLERRRKGGRE